MSVETDVIIATLSIAIPTIVAVILFLMGRSRKLITYKKLTEEALLSVSDELKNKLKIYYDSQLIENVHLFKLEIANSGTKEIQEKDYNEPITIFFGKTAKILSCEITEYKPLSFPITYEFDSSVIKLSKTLINPKEAVVIKTLVSKPEFYNVYGRIAGGKIKCVVPKTKSPDFPWYVLIGIAGLAIIGMTVSGFLGYYALAGFFMIMLFFPIGVAVLIVIAQFYWYLREKLQPNKS